MPKFREFQLWTVRLQDFFEMNKDQSRDSRLINHKSSREWNCFREMHQHWNYHLSRDWELFLVFVDEIPYFLVFLLLFLAINILILAFYDAEHNLVKFISLYVLFSPPENDLSSQRKMFACHCFIVYPSMNPAWKDFHFYLVGSGLFLVWVKSFY